MRKRTAESLKVRDIMSRDVITFTPEHTLREVVDALTTHGISGAPVIAGEEVVGVVSKSDIVDFLACSPPVPRESDEFSEWGDTLAGDEQSDEDELPRLFFMDLWDNAGADVLERFSESASPEWDLLSEHTADSVMTRNVETVSPDDDVETAARRLRRKGVHRLVVLRSGKLVGILSAMDLAALVARN